MWCPTAASCGGRRRGADPVAEDLAAGLRGARRPSRRFHRQTDVSSAMCRGTRSPSAAQTAAIAGRRAAALARSAAHVDLAGSASGSDPSTQTLPAPAVGMRDLQAPRPVARFEEKPDSRGATRAVHQDRSPGAGARRHSDRHTAAPAPAPNRRRHGAGARDVTRSCARRWGSCPGSDRAFSAFEDGGRLKYRTLGDDGREHRLARRETRRWRGQREHVPGNLAALDLLVRSSSPSLDLERRMDLGYGPLDCRP